MIHLELADLLAVGARVLGVDGSAVVELADLDDVARTVEEARAAGESGDAANVAAALLGGVIRRRPFARANRQIAVLAALQVLALNGWDLDLGSAKEVDLMLDLVALDDQRVSTAERIRARLRGRGPEELPGFEDLPGFEELPGFDELGRIEELRDVLGIEEFDVTEVVHGAKEGDDVFERFDDRARMVLVFAQEEARLLSHTYIGTEHLLLGLVREGAGPAAQALENLGISLAAVRAQVETIVGRGKQMPSGHIPFTPRAKKVLELALREAIHLGHTYIGTEHILLGLVREGEGVAAQVLVKLGGDLRRVRKEVTAFAGRSVVDPGAMPAGGATPGGRRSLILHELNAVLDENDRLHADTDRLSAEIARLRNLLRQHDIDPDAAA